MTCSASRVFRGCSTSSIDGQPPRSTNWRNHKSLLLSRKRSEFASGRARRRLIRLQTSEIRPYVSGAILRNVKFTQARYESFIALQDKLHQNLARQRSLVAIGTHDLDTLKGPFTYEALPPKDINFIPLNQTKEMNGEELMEFYEVWHRSVANHFPSLG